MLGNLGSGTFGQVFECRIGGSSDKVAVKVIKNQAAYYHQARVEIGILQLLNTKGDPYDECHIVRLKDFFMHRGHLCLVFELLSLNLYELIRRNKFRGLSLSLVRVFVTHILEALVILKDSSIIHCDIKPENILLKDAKSGEVKLIDFGSACFKNRTIYTYIQSRFYRSPEVILGHGYTESVDMWSLGCVAAELFLGLPLFPAASEFDLLERITATIGNVPRNMLINSRHASMYYAFENIQTHSDPRLLTMSEYQALNMKKPAKGKQYFKHTLLKDIIHAYPFKSGLSEGEKSIQIEQRDCFIAFLEGLLHIDPKHRMSPSEALSHPYITGGTLVGVSKVSHKKPEKEVEKSKLRAEEVALPTETQARQVTQTRPIPQHPASLIYRGLGHAGHMSNYTPAGSLHKIVNNVGSYMSDTSASVSGSLPMPMETPPSRSLGARLRMPICSEPLPSPAGDKVMPIMEIPGQESTFKGSFQPSSVRTFRNYMATKPSFTPLSGAKECDSSSTRSTTGDDEEEAVKDKSEWNLDEDPLWSDDSPSDIADQMEKTTL